MLHTSPLLACIILTVELLYMIYQETLDVLLWPNERSLIDVVRVINSSLSLELWEWQVTCCALTPLLILHCLFHLFGQAEAPPPEHNVWLWSLDFLDHKDIFPENWHLSRVEFELRMCVQPPVHTWLIASQDKVWVRGDTAESRLCMFRPCCCNVIVWSFSNEQSISSTACCTMLRAVSSKRLVSFSDLVVADDISSENEIVAFC